MHCARSITCRISRWTKLHISYLVSPKTTYLTHVSHQMGRHAVEEPRLPEGVHFAYDGLTVEIPDEP